MRILTLLGSVILLSAVLTADGPAQSRTASRTRPGGVEAELDLPWIRLRYVDDAEAGRTRRYRPPTSLAVCGRCGSGWGCDEREWKKVRKCEAKVRELERREAEWERDSRKRQARFEEDMRRRELEWVRQERERRRDHERDMANRWDELRHG